MVSIVQNMFHCGHVHEDLELNDRTYICPKCGHVMDRDYQAAVNIDREGLNLLLKTYRDKDLDPIKFGKDNYPYHIKHKIIGGTPRIA